MDWIYNGVLFYEPCYSFETKTIKGNFTMTLSSKSGWDPAGSVVVPR